MTSYAANMLQVKFCGDFVSNEYIGSPKPFIFWDTCALLDAIRFLARKGNLSTFQAISQISTMVHNQQIYSLASELFIKEWNDHIDEAKADLLNFLKETTIKHSTTLSVVNYLYSSSYNTVSLEIHHLHDIFDTITKTIIHNTFFIAETNEIKLKAYDRVVQKIAPARKKNEAKDCTIWETILEVADNIKK